MTDRQELLKDIEQIRGNLYELLLDAQYDFQDANVISTNRILNSFIAEYHRMINK